MNSKSRAWVGVVALCATLMATLASGCNPLGDGSTTGNNGCETPLGVGGASGVGGGFGGAGGSTLGAGGGSPMGGFPGCGDPGVPAWAPKSPMVVGLTTTRLRAIASAQGVGAGKTGVQLNREIGLVFENWVLTTLDQKTNRWTTLIDSPRRKSANNGGLPASVIPEFVSDLTLAYWGGMMAIPFPQSQFWEVKAVTGTLSRSTSQYQILGLLDVATLSAAGTSTVPKHPPPAVVFTITWNTKFAPSMLSEATQLGVAVWAQAVFEESSTPNNPDPDLFIGPLVPMNPDVYVTSVPFPGYPSGVGSKLLSPKTAPMPIPGDPDPPEVD